MIKNQDGSVVLSEQEFRMCVAFCEMSPSEFAAVLGQGSEISLESLHKYIQRRVWLDSYAPDEEDSLH